MYTVISTWTPYAVFRWKAGADNICEAPDSGTAVRAATVDDGEH